MMAVRFSGVAPAMLMLAAFFLPTTTAQTPTLNIPTGLPASCTPLATLLSKYPPPKDNEALDDALNSGVDAFLSSYSATAATATKVSRLNTTSLCEFIITTQIPSALPSLTASLSSYVSAAGIWIEEHGLEEAASLLVGDCTAVVQPGDEEARGDLDYAIGFGQCYKILAWDQRTSSHPGATTTKASSTSDATPGPSGSAGSVTSPTGQPSETDAAPPNAAGRREGDLFWILVTVILAIRAGGRADNYEMWMPGYRRL
ncbi:hypothetical protein F5Y14DRAFT_77839 [Nemania sp. NC0429]|nr:hypothetical protein F5Y14DRAFT_77839 [Nemania sp. NC0429]